MIHAVSLSEEQRQMILLALASLAVERPGWLAAIRETARQMDNVVNGEPQMFSRLFDTCRAAKGPRV